MIGDKIMATAIKAIPTLHGKEAKSFCAMQKRPSAILRDSKISKNIPLCNGSQHFGKGRYEIRKEAFMFLSSQCFLVNWQMTYYPPVNHSRVAMKIWMISSRMMPHAMLYYLMGKSYCFRKNDDPTKIVCAFTVSNDSIRIYDLPRSRKDYMKSLTHHEKPLRRYPGILIGRLGVNKDFVERE